MIGAWALDCAGAAAETSDAGGLVSAGVLAVAVWDAGVGALFSGLDTALLSTGSSDVGFCAPTGAGAAFCGRCCCCSCFWCCC